MTTPIKLSRSRHLIGLDGSDSTNQLLPKRREKLIALQHRYNTWSRTKHMEHTTKKLEQQHEDLRGEIEQVKELMKKTFELLTQGATANATAVVQGMLVYPPGYTLPFNVNIPPYEMPHDWNTNAEEHPTSLANLNGQAGLALVIQKGTPHAEGKLHLLEERLWVIEGTDRHGLDVVDLCLVPDVGLRIDFKMPKFEKYKASSCPMCT
ncbi:hypothetical protein CR513_58703, partial [Mucuna pruriens]